MNGYVEVQLALVGQRQARLREEAAAERLAAAIRRERRERSAALGSPSLVAWARRAVASRRLATGR